MKSFYKLTKWNIIGKAHYIEDGVEKTIDTATVFDVDFNEATNNLELSETHEFCFVWDRCPLWTEVSRRRMFK